MSRRHWRIGLAAMGTAAGLVAGGGCGGGDGLPRQPVSGSVTLDGRQVKEGVISFFPTERVLHGIMVAGATSIEDGRFSISRDSGLIPGRYKIAIHCADGKKKEARKPERDADNATEISKELIPRRYNSDTMLEIEIKDHVIKDMKIDLTSQ